MPVASIFPVLPGAPRPSTASKTGQAPALNRSDSSRQKFPDPSAQRSLSDLHLYNMAQAMHKSADRLLDDLADHITLLGTPERAQVLLGAAQNPLLAEQGFARTLLPKLSATIVGAPSATQQLLVKWWIECPGSLLLDRVVKPMLGFLSRELLATKMLNLSVMNVIKVLALVEEANQISRALPPESFYNQLISEKMDVQDHYTAWRQTHMMHATRREMQEGVDVPFSFCSYPFLLDARAKSNLMHIEARFQMEQSVAQARMEQQLYGGSCTRKDERVLTVPATFPSRDLPRTTVAVRDLPGTATAAGQGSRDASKEGTSSSSRAPNDVRQQDQAVNPWSNSVSPPSAVVAPPAAGRRVSRGLRDLFLNMLRTSTGSRSVRSSNDSASDDTTTTTRPDQGPGKGQAEGPQDGFSLPSPSDCPMPGVHSDMSIVRVRRTHLLCDAMAEIGRQFKGDLLKPLRVHFIGEDGIDAGGVKKEFFLLLIAELLSPEIGLLEQQEESNTFWFKQAKNLSEEEASRYLLLGVVLGLAVYNRVLLDFPLPLVLYKLLLGRGQQPLGLRDLEDMQPSVARSLRALLKYDPMEGGASVEDAFCLSFSIEMVMQGGGRELVELKPGGDDIVVSSENRHEYVELLVDHLLNKSVAPHFKAFSRGFRMLCDGPATRLFNPQELERLVCGNPHLDFTALQQNAKYEGGFSSSTEVIQWMWEIVRSVLTMEEKKRFLKFFTGSDRAPIGGLGSLKCVVQRDGTDSGKLPTSHTCFNTLLLPEYASKAKLASLLKLAIMNSEGFGLE
eukprot:gene23306-30543_t